MFFLFWGEEMVGATECNKSDPGFIPQTTTIAPHEPSHSLLLVLEVSLAAIFGALYLATTSKRKNWECWQLCPETKLAEQLLAGGHFCWVNGKIMKDLFFTYNTARQANEGLSGRRSQIFKLIYQILWTSNASFFKVLPFFRDHLSFRMFQKYLVRS